MYGLVECKHPFLTIFAVFWIIYQSVEYSKEKNRYIYEYIHGAIWVQSWKISAFVVFVLGIEALEVPNIENIPSELQNSYSMRIRKTAHYLPITIMVLRRVTLAVIS